MRRLDSVDDFIAFPGYPGLPESPYLLSEVANFLIDVRGRRFDLAVQLHGSGSITNPLVALFGARHEAGFGHAASVRAGEEPHFIPWPHRGHEIERLLALTDYLGLPRRGLSLDFPVRDEDRARPWPCCGPA